MMVESTLQEQVQTQELNQSRSDSRLHGKNQTTTTQSSTSTLEFVALLPLAIFADLIGGLDLTVFGSVIVRIINIPIVLVLWLWRVFKHGPGLQKNDYTYQLFATFLIEMSPFGIVPTWTTFVIYAYLKDKNIAKNTLGRKLNKTNN